MAESTINTLLQGIESSKDNIRLSITNKGVTVPTEAKLASFSNYIDQIPIGLFPSGNKELTQKTATDVSSYATATVRECEVSMIGFNDYVMHIGTGGVEVQQTDDATGKSSDNDIDLVIPIKVYREYGATIPGTLYTPGFLDHDVDSYGYEYIDAPGSLHGEVYMQGLNTYFSPTESTTADLKPQLTIELQNGDGGNQVAYTESGHNWNIKRASIMYAEMSNDGVEIYPNPTDMYCQVYVHGTTYAYFDQEGWISSTTQSMSGGSLSVLIPTAEYRWIGNSTTSSNIQLITADGYLTKGYSYLQDLTLGNDQYVTLNNIKFYTNDQETYSDMLRFLELNGNFSGNYRQSTKTIKISPSFESSMQVSLSDNAFVKMSSVQDTNHHTILELTDSNGTAHGNILDTNGNLKSGVFNSNIRTSTSPSNPQIISTEGWMGTSSRLSRVTLEANQIVNVGTSEGWVTAHQGTDEREMVMEVTSFTVSLDVEREDQCHVAINSEASSFVVEDDFGHRCTNLIKNVSGDAVLNVSTYYTGSSAPSSSLGSDGDIYLQR